MIKVTDIIDNYDYYDKNDEQEGINKMNKNAKILIELAKDAIPKDILKELKIYLVKYS